ncbi:hypothetical protein OGAPHI_004775 [Ogataea philodendri]|uniref:Uncharacterized protein n=1 Tax=Ogataea philodendri TaxID=1378263 RepID=A0A9P8P2X7_9ASCO|nr:uncharacterized protein OGAPHI_004775 [Ogataea philodendri]KAH3664061.1 hypothetical protein OGAPHI_004775 [Ogataea philodendri]
MASGSRYGLRIGSLIPPGTDGRGLGAGAVNAGDGLTLEANWGADCDSEGGRARETDSCSTDWLEETGSGKNGPSFLVIAEISTDSRSGSMLS